jgi:hypothetical protein
MASGERGCLAVAIDVSGTIFVSTAVAITKLCFKALARSNCHKPSAKKRETISKTATT